MRKWEIIRRNNDIEEKSNLQSIEEEIYFNEKANQIVMNRQICPVEQSRKDEFSASLPESDQSPCSGMQC